MPLFGYAVVSCVATRDAMVDETPLRHTHNLRVDRTIAVPCEEVLPLLPTARVVPLVAVSGAECVEALTGAGFVVVARSSTGATLTKGLRFVVVPEAGMLVPDELTSILRSAGIPYSDFLDLLSEAPTDPAISRTRLSPTAASR